MSIRRMQVFLATAAVTVGLVAPLLVSNKALAANETYTWNGTGMRVTGGDTDPARTSSLSRSSLTLPNREIYTGTIYHRTGCTVRVSIVLPMMGTQGSLAVDNGSTCTGQAILGGYNNPNQRIEGSRAATVAIRVWSPRSFAESPAQLGLIFTRDGTHYGSYNAARTVGGGQDQPEERQTVYYSYQLQLPTGTYRVCGGDILPCRDLIVPNSTTMNLTWGTEPSIGASDELCDDTGLTIGWVVCGAINLLADAASLVDEYVIGLIKIDTNSIFNTDIPSGRAFYSAWSVMRSISYALLIIIGLIMVISQIAGLEIFDAYTIRKMLPKLVLAVMFIGASWWGLKLLFNASNDAAFALEDLIKIPFSGIPVEDSIDGGDVTMGYVLGVILAPAAIAGGVAYLAVLGLGGILALVASALLFIFSAFVLLEARNVVAFILIISAPIAIICSTFEPFKKLFTLWKTLLITILLSVPAIAAIIALSHVGALIAFIAEGPAGLNVITAIAILIGGYALIWGVFKKLDSVAGQLGNVVSATTGKLSKGLADYRKDALQRRFKEAVEGRRTFGIGGVGFGANMAAGLTRRAQLAAQPGGSFRGHKAVTAEQGHDIHTAQKLLENDRNRSAGNDDVNEEVAALGTRATMSSAHAALMRRRRLIADTEGKEFNEAEQSARATKELQELETNFGGRIGSRPMAIATAMAANSSNTAYRQESWRTTEQALETSRNTLKRLVDEDALTTVDAAAILTKNKARLDLAGGGFSTAMDYVEGKKTTQEYLDSALVGNGPGALLGQRWETVRALAPTILRKLESPPAETKDYMTGKSVEISQEDSFDQELATAAALYDVAAQVSPQSARILAQGVMSQPVTRRDPTTGADVTMSVQQWLEKRRAESTKFEELRREIYGRTQRQAQQNLTPEQIAAIEQQRLQGGGTQGPQTGFPGQTT